MTAYLIYFRDGDTDHLVELPFDPEERCDASQVRSPAAPSVRRRVETIPSPVQESPDCRHPPRA